MSDDDFDLRRMFVAQRSVDEEDAPLFKEVLSTAELMPKNSILTSTSMLIRVGLSAIALSLVIGIAVWMNPTVSREQEIVTASPNELQDLHQACDSVLARLESLDSGTIEAHALEMEWRTATDSLIPFETLTFNLRTLP